MICKKCGHRNKPMAAKCGSCGQDLGNNEHLEMFQAQAQMSKGVELPPPVAAPAPVADPNFVADDFFSDLSNAAPAAPEPPPMPAARPARATPPPVQAASFFAEAQTVEEPAFETEIKLRPEDEQRGPDEHPLYSPPKNPIIESFIARRAAARR